MFLGERFDLLQFSAETGILDLLLFQFYQSIEIGFGSVHYGWV